MTDFTSVAIPKPKDWQALERHCRLLFELSFSDTAVQNNGRVGQPQHGVDIFGRRDGGRGRWVGVQCKGKDADYGGEVTEVELRAEVRKTRGFVPSIEEFILVTTAPNDEKIQRAARVLEEELKTAGRRLVIQVWGWERVQQEINRFPAAIREFHPDATPFTDQILSAAEETKRLVLEGTAATAERLAGLERQLALVTRLPQIAIAIDTSSSADALDKELHAEIDGYRDLLRADQPRTALSLLMRLRDRLGSSASDKVRYRLLSNIGAAHYNLGEYAQASDFLLAAAPLNPDDPISLANKVAALLIKGRRVDAREVAVEALARYPESQELALQRLQVLSPDETVETVWQELSSKAKDASIVFGFRIGATRELGDEDWHALANEGRLIYPNDPPLMILHAESVVDRLLRTDPGAVGRTAPSTPSQRELWEAGEFLEKTWRASTGRETPSKPACAHNAALAWHILGEASRAAALLDDLMASGYEAEDTKELRIATYRRQQQYGQAIKLADTLSDTAGHRILRADLRISTAPGEARTILKDRSKFLEPNDIVAASLVVLEAYIFERNYDAALGEADSLEVAVPGHPQGALARFRVKRSRGDRELGDDLDRARARVIDATDFPTRFLVADALASAERFDDVVDLLEGRTSYRFDSPALRALVAATVNADRRATLRKILSEVSEDLANEPLYAKAKIALSVRAGSIAEAESEIRAFLRREPTNLEIQLQLFHALYRQNKIDELKFEISAPAERFKGEPLDFIKLAHFKDDFGDWREAHVLAYRTLLKNQTSSSVAIGYIGIFLRPGHSREMRVGVSTVENDVAVALRTEDATVNVYIIEPDVTLRPSANYLPPEHKIAGSLYGKAVGDTIELPDQSKATILWIKPKVLHALHEVMENFTNRFPEAEGFERLKVEADTPAGLEPMLRRLRDRHDAAEEIGKLYETGAMTLSLVGRSLGCDAIEAMVGLASTGKQIRICEGGQFERQQAFAAIEANCAKGCVVDAATLHVIRRLHIEDAVIALCGTIHVTDETVRRLQQKIYDLTKRIDELDISIVYREGNYFRTETTPEEKRSILDLFEADKTWLDQSAIIVPAAGSRDPSPEWRPLIERFGSDFLDDIRAAEGARLLLVSEDQALRNLAKADYVVPSTWLQPLLMMALDRKIMDEGKYRDSIIAMIDSQFHFISVSWQLLASSIRGTRGHSLPTVFEKLASKLGGKNAELSSHLSVAFQVAAAAWRDSDLTQTVRKGVVGRLLERLIEDRDLAEIRMIIATWLQLERQAMRVEGMQEYVFEWLRGHFIFPE